MRILISEHHSHSQRTRRHPIKLSPWHNVRHNQISPLILAAHLIRYSVTGAAALYAPGTNGKRDSLLGYINGAGVLNSDGPDAWYNKWQFAVPSDASQAMNVKCPVCLPL